MVISNSKNIVSSVVRIWLVILSPNQKYKLEWVKTRTSLAIGTTFSIRFCRYSGLFEVSWSTDFGVYRRINAILRRIWLWFIFGDGSGTFGITLNSLESFWDVLSPPECLGIQILESAAVTTRFYQDCDRCSYSVVTFRHDRTSFENLDLDRTLKPKVSLDVCSCWWE